MSRTLGAKKKMFYDSKMFHDVLLSFTIRDRAHRARHLPRPAFAHDRRALALPAARGYHELGGHGRHRDRSIPTAGAPRGAPPLPSRPASHFTPADAS
ncbi:hypothetical protein [uncultured Massilia sp.]|uniref:hypothetical protein n=1 Tax=uncultured Massilia sp. TaxID=169973 RepID=UPI0025DDE471|nr:hypothetical protein [uncultured Massilia sp.]